MPKPLRILLISLAALVLTVAVALALIVKLVLAPAPGEWSERVRLLGPVQADLGMPTVLRLLTVPWFAPLLSGRGVDTVHGRFEAQWDDGASALRITCTPCKLAVPELGDAPVQAEHLQFTVRRDVDQLFGTLQATVAGAPAPLRGRWTGRLSQTGLNLSLDTEDVALATWYRLLVPQLPELARARIGGTAWARAEIAFPERSLSLSSRISRMQVEGLGAQSLLDSPAITCGLPARLAPDHWLARGAVAALDPEYFQHGGVQGNALAYTHVGQPVAAPPAAEAARKKPAGRPARNAPAAVPSIAMPSAQNAGPTMGEQVAHLLLPPMPQPLAARLRDMLYAAELDQVPGKAAVLQAYLDRAPWGDGLCGAEAAARRYFKRAARQLDPTQAMWLATMLPQPDAALARWRQEGEIDRARTRAVVEAVHGLTPGQRVSLLRGAATARYTAPPPSQ